MVKWQKKHPDLFFKMEYGPNHRIFEMLLKGSLDLGVVTEAPASKYFKAQHIGDEEFVLISNPKMKINLKSLETLLETPFINYPGSDVIFYQWFEAHYKNSGEKMSELKFRSEINNLESVILLAEKGLGATILPRMPLEAKVKQGKLKIHKTKKRVFNPLYLVHRKEQILTRKVEKLKDLIQSSFLR